jgi:putative FmdB family regulatory protein
MPFYEYECSACKFYVEALQKISDPPLRKCPSCKKQTMRRLVSAPVFRLKGGGWYETDFKSEKEEKRNLAGKEEAAPAAPADDKAAKSDAKADTAKATETKADAPDTKPASRARPAAKAARKPVTSKSKPKPQPKSKARPRAAKKRR